MRNLIKLGIVKIIENMVEVLEQLSIMQKYQTEKLMKR